jgi:pilus assembly protein CpaB
MNATRLAIIVVALVAAVGLALFVHNMFGKKGPAPTPVAVAAPAPPMTRVLVARTPIAVGERLAPDNMTWQDWPAATVNAAYITDGAARPQLTGAAAAVNKAKTAVTDIANNGGPKLQTMVGAVAKDPIYAGEPITAAKLIRSGDTNYMAVRLPEGMRAMALPITPESGAGGFINPGDRIDVLSTHSDNQSGAAVMVTDTVLSNALVLAVGGATESAKNSSSGGSATVTIQVPVEDVVAVARARTQSGLTLVLRSYADIGGRTAGPTAGQTVRVFKGGGPAQMVIAQ